MTVSEMHNGIVSWRKTEDAQVVVLWDREARADLSHAFCCYVNNLSGIDKNDKQHQKEHSKNAGYFLRLPIFVTPYPYARKEGGFMIPKEFVIGINEMDDIPSRITQLKLIYLEDANPPFSVSLLRAMSVGAFRKFFFLDDDNHGQGEMDPMDIPRIGLKNWPWVEKLEKQITFCRNCGNKEPEKKKTEKAKAFNTLFDSELQSILEVTESLKTS